MRSLNLKGLLYPLEQTQVMGILNITPDSFFDGGVFNGFDAALKQADQMIKDGAHWIDIGGYSSRPNADEVSEQEELDRVIPVIEGIRQSFDCPISIDTFRSKVAQSAVEAGASMVNDISGGQLDPKMYETVASLGVPYVLMHMRGTPQTMQSLTDYDDIFLDLMQYFQHKISQLDKLGVDVILDLGFGFAKTLDQNYQLLRHLSFFNTLGKPLLVGISRKSMIYKLLETTPAEALNGTTVLHTLAIQQGAQFLRVHDVKAASEVIKIMEHLSQCQPPSPAQERSNDT